ncbi:MAG: putative DNA binding domain-containing protein [Bacteroidaceae bacterium]|nr:putative DNA binding domain-containing protein [Bacteroidaceae bacterium]
MLHRLIAEGEHQQQDFKYEISDARKIARTLSAFANTDGGRLLIGVKDNGKIAGVRSDEEIYMVEAAASLYCMPPVECRMSIHRVEGHNVVIAEVDAAGTLPVRAQLDDGRWCAFVRIADENIVASPVQMALWREATDDTNTLLPFTQREQSLLRLLTDAPEPLTLNRFARLGHLPRHRAVKLLAQFVRFGLVEQQFAHHTFVYVVCEVGNDKDY